MVMLGKRIRLKQLRIPPTARPDIPHCDEGLGFDGYFLGGAVVHGVIALTDQNQSPSR
jgi:hypothetical protein